MPLLPQLTDLERDLEQFRQHKLDGIEAAHHAAVIMVQGHRWLWGLPDDRLVALLNAIPNDELMAVFGRNTELGAALNAVLDDANSERFPTRAITVAGRNVQLDPQTGEWSLPEPEPEPESE